SCKDDEGFELHWSASSVIGKIGYRIITRGKRGSAQNFRPAWEAPASILRKTLVHYAWHAHGFSAAPRSGASVMRSVRSTLVPCALILLAGCATEPTTPSIRVLPAPYKPFEVFQGDFAA